MSRVSAPWSARAKPQACRSWCGCVGDSKPAQAAIFTDRKPCGAPVKGLAVLAHKKSLPVAFNVARSVSHALITRNSSPRSGCVVDSPFLSRVTCITWLSVSTWQAPVRRPPTRAGRAGTSSEASNGHGPRCGGLWSRTIVCPLPEWSGASCRP